MTKTGLVIERTLRGPEVPCILLVDGYQAVMRIWGTGNGEGTLVINHRVQPAIWKFESMEDLGDMVVLKECVII